jgi:mRNA interferase MazF
LPLRVVVPITDWKERYAVAPWMIKMEPDKHNSLAKPSAIDCFQIRSVSVERMVKIIGVVSTSKILQVQDAIARVIGIL